MKNRDTPHNDAATASEPSARQLAADAPVPQGPTLSGIQDASDTEARAGSAPPKDWHVPQDAALWLDVGKLITAAELFCESFTDHADRCRACTANWQTLKAKIAAVRAHLPQEQP